MSSPRPTNTRARLLDAGLDLLKEDPRPAKISAASVSRQIGLSRGAFYRYWDNSDAYLRDLVGHGMGRERARSLAEVERKVRGLIAGGAEFGEIITKGARWGLDAIGHDPVFLVQMSLWSRHARDEQASAALAQVYSDFHEHFLPLYREILDTADFELQLPFTFENLAVAITALAEGLVLQRSVNQESVDDELFGWVVLALASVVAQPKPERDLTDRLREQLASRSTTDEGPSGD